MLGDLLKVLSLDALLLEMEEELEKNLEKDTDE
jgi:hypothetical protein